MIFPKHVAIIMDGSGRWAAKSGLLRQEGHEKGSEAVHESLRYCLENNIKALTLFAFSTENRNRPEQEVNFLMNLLHKFLEKERENLIEKEVSLKWIGRQDRIPEKTKELFLDVIKDTSQKKKLTLTLAIDYGSRDEIVRAARKFAVEVQTNRMAVNDLTEENFLSFLDTKDLPSPDLLIRTSGEQRVSNFLLYQIAYTEFYFSPKLWPEFDYDEFEKAVKEFSVRNRKFGGVSSEK